MTTTHHLLDLDDLALGLIIYYATPEEAYCMTLVLRETCKRLNELVGKARWPTARTRIYDYPAEKGYLSLIKWLRANGAPCDEWTCCWAANSGCIETLKWLRANGAPWNILACAQAAKGGHLETLKWLRANGAPWNELSCEYAAENGHLETLKWLRASGAPWNVWACIWAVKNGHLETVRWALNNAAPWYRPVCVRYARANGHQEAVTLLEKLVQ